MHISSGTISSSLGISKYWIKSTPLSNVYPDQNSFHHHHYCYYQSNQSLADPQSHCGTAAQSDLCAQMCQNVPAHCEQLGPSRKFTKHKLKHKARGLGAKTFMEEMNEIGKKYYQSHFFRGVIILSG